MPAVKKREQGQRQQSIEADDIVKTHLWLATDAAAEWLR